MATEELTVERYLTKVKSLSDELIETGSVAISMREHDDRRLCKNMIASIALQLDLNSKQYEVDFDGDGQEFIMVLTDDEPEPDPEPDDEQSED